MNVVNNLYTDGIYSQFYKGTEPLKTYGSYDGAGKKDTLVKYEFSTTDAQGNKIMDPMSKEEALKAMEDVRSQYGDNVLLVFSGDGLSALAESIKAQSRKDGMELTEEEKAIRAQQQAELEKYIVHMENTHRLIIPNIQTNAKLYGSLENADEEVIKASNGIIRNYLMPSNIGEMSETQRREMIAFGLEEAKYLAENYLDEEHGRDFLSAMEMIAKYGLNGTVSENGKVTYHVEKGPMVGAPDDYVSAQDIIREKAPDLYLEMQDLNRRIIKGETGWGRRFIELQNRINQVLNTKSSSGLTYYEESASKYKNWKNEIVKTELPSVFQNVQYQDFQLFMAGLQRQSSLSDTWINDQVNRMVKWLTESV